MKKWTPEALVIFVVAVCGVSWSLILFGQIAPPLYLGIPSLGFSVSLSTIFSVGASTLPGIFVLMLFKESRLTIFKRSGGVSAYVSALALGISLPFAAHLGGADPHAVWDGTTAATLGRVFLLNLGLTPFWEEIVWRGFFYQKLAMLLSPKRSLILGAFVWTVWHFGFLVFLYRNGLGVVVLQFVLVQYFIMGVILGLVLQLAHGALLPCIVFHAAYNAAVSAYYGRYDRVQNIQCYEAQTIVMAAAAAMLFVLLSRMRKLQPSVTEIHGSTVPRQP